MACRVRSARATKARIDFGPIYERAQGQPEYQPGEVLAGDALIARGSGQYHADKRRAK